MTQIAAESGLVEAPAGRPISLRQRAMKGGAWTIAGYGGSQALRFGSNLAVVWILSQQTSEPQRIFGVMAYAITVLQGLALFSDLGIGASVIHDKQGEDEKFLRTAFSIQAVRGVVLWLVAVALAAPVATHHDEPVLRWLIPVCGLTAMINGLASTAQHRVNRRLELRTVTLLQLLSQGIGAATTIAWALASPTVWALAAGAIAGSLAHTISSHFLLRDRRDWFGFDREAFRRLIRFGRWIFLATILTFLTNSLDKLLFPELIDFKRLGVYYVASQIVQVAMQGGRMLIGKVLFPALAEVARERPERLNAKLLEVRRAVLTPTAAGLLLLFLGGDLFIRLIYPATFHDAGWMLQVAAAGAIFFYVGRTYGSAWLAVGNSLAHMWMMGISLVSIVITSLTGFWLAGERGFIVGLACAGVLAYPPIAALAWWRGTWQWRLDGAILGATILVVVIAQLTGFGVQW
jgi:O-antigen/teichoic acid export membrane protein